MIGARGSVPYPPQADGAPVRAFAASLRQLSDGLRRSSGSLVSTAAGSSDGWIGGAADTFGSHVAARSRTVDSVAVSVGSAAPVLETYAAAIDATAAAYTSAALAEHAARAGLPWTAGALAAALAAQQSAVAALLAAGSACAGGLLTANAEVAAALFAGVDRDSFHSILGTVTDVWGRVGAVAGDPDASDVAVSAAVAEVDAAMTVAQRQVDAAVGPRLGSGTAQGRTAPSSAPVGSAVRPGASAAAATAATPEATAHQPRSRGAWDELFGTRHGTTASVTNDVVGTLGSLSELIERTRPRLSAVIDPATGQRTVVDGSGAPVRAGSPILDPYTGRPLDLPPAGSGSGSGPYRSSILDPHTGRPFEVAADGRSPAPGRSVLVDPRTGQPFAADRRGRATAGPRVSAVRAPLLTDLLTDAATLGGSLDQRLDRIASEVAGMEVRLDRPIGAPAPSGWHTAGRVLQAAGRVANVVGGAVGAYDVYRGVRDRDGFRAADGAIAVGLAVAGALTLATPVGWALLAVGAAWSVGSYLSGDVPLTRRVWGAARAGATRAAAATRATLAVPVTGTTSAVPPPR